MNPLLNSRAFWVWRGVLLWKSSLCVMRLWMSNTLTKKFFNLVTIKRKRLKPSSED